MPTQTRKYPFATTCLLGSAAVVGALTACSSIPPPNSPDVREDEVEFHNRFAPLSMYPWLEQDAAEAALIDGSCRALGEREARGRVGPSLIADMRNSAAELDSIIVRDGGNAYIVSEYEWERIRPTATQLVINFTILDCEI